MRRSWVTVCVLAASVAVAESASPLHLQVAFDPRALVPRSILAAAVDEAARIWAPYGVSLSENNLQPDGPAAVMTLAVALDVEHDAAGGDNGLGEILFASDGTPDATITLFYRALTRLVIGPSATVGADGRLWPRARRDQALARAMGRALAHEVGHYVLRSPHHARHGLMQATHHASTLTQPGRTAFSLSDVERARLNIVLDSLAPQTLARSR